MAATIARAGHQTIPQKGNAFRLRRLCKGGSKGNNKYRPCENAKLELQKSCSQPKVATHKGEE